MTKIQEELDLTNNVAATSDVESFNGLVQNDIPPGFQDDPRTESLKGLSNHLALLPPPSEEVTRYHNLDAEADMVAPWNPYEPEVRMLPPATSVSDAFTMAQALQNEDVRQRMIERYGEDSYESASKKARAIVEVATAQTKPIDVPLRQYSRIRRGLPQHEDLPQIDTSYPARLEPFFEKPLNEVPHEPLIYNAEESRVVLDALRTAYVYPTSKQWQEGVANQVVDTSPRNEDALAVADVLARYSPSHIDRAFFGAVLEHSGVKLDAGKAPDYHTIS